MRKIMWKTNPLITHNLSQTWTQTKTWKGKKTETHIFWRIWVHWGALAHLLEEGIIWDNLYSRRWTLLQTQLPMPKEIYRTLARTKNPRGNTIPMDWVMKTSNTLKLQKTNYFHSSRTLAPDWFHPLVEHTFP